jgi:hypothetical protein
MDFANMEFEAFKEYMEIQRARDHPPFRTEELMTAMLRPEVEAARCAFLNFVAKVTSNKVIPTNYYDEVLGVAIASIEDPTTDDSIAMNTFSQKLIRLIELYLAFVDTLVPFQPGEEVIRAIMDKPMFPWEVEKDDITFKVFYFIEGCGGYWITRGDNFRDAVKATKILMNAQH